LLGRMIREPLLQFLLIGLLLFTLYAVVSGGKWRGDRRITINDAIVAAIVERYQGLWRRPPTRDELQTLIDEYISDEVRFREGVALGLDKDDPVIRRRVLQKLEVISEESNRRAVPTDEQLQAYLEAHADRYAAPGTVAFDQVIFDPARHGEATQAHISVALAHLRADSSSVGVGDPSLLPRHVSEVSVDQVTRDFGEEFAAAVVNLSVGSWEGPVRSAFGLHLVRVVSRSPSRPSTLAESRAALERDYDNDQRLLAAQEYERRLRQDYEIIIESSAADGLGKGATP
jgi:hypothetical protein